MEEIAAPSDLEMQEQYRELDATLAHGGEAAWREGFSRWDRTRRTWKSFANLTRLRYTQDTRDDARRDAQRDLDRRTPALTALETSAKRRFLASDSRAMLVDEIGAQAFALWDADVTTFQPAIVDDLVREADLTRSYTEVLATAEATLAGERVSLGALGVHLQDPDRETRHAAERARWNAFEERAEALDAIFDELVRVRDRMARTLGFSSYTELGYKRMRRVDYGPADVAAYRDEIARVVVPFAGELVRAGAAAAGIERAYIWDETTLGVQRRIAPLGDRAWILEQTRGAFYALDPALGSFVETLLENGMLDVDSRPGKALGAYCTNFPTRREPFVFANFNGTRGDIKTLVHELGHAFQAYRSRDAIAVDYLTPTYESAEIHSMALEFLSWPQMERYFGSDASHYRREHLQDAMLFLPYGAAVDHFQHLVYAHPGATPRERHEMWREMERRYLPWRAYGDLAFPAKGGLWQEKRHIFVAPFYYIDYTLALCCALQLRQRSNDDVRATFETYVTLCGRGGEAPFRTLVRDAGLRSPFESGALEDIVTSARATLLVG